MIRALVPQRSNTWTHTVLPLFRRRTPVTICDNLSRRFEQQKQQHDLVKVANSDIRTKEQFLLLLLYDFAISKYVSVYIVLLLGVAL